MTESSSSLSGSFFSADRFTLIRALGHLETDEAVRCADYLAAEFLGSEWKKSLRFRNSLIKQFEKSAPGIYHYGLARTHFFDAMLEEVIREGTTQVLIMGAGFDTRAYRFRADSPIVFVEFDRLDLHRTKISRAAMSEVASTDNTIVPIPVDFSRGGIVDLLSRLDLDYTKPVTALAEGLLYYLDESFFTALLAFVGGRCAAGSRIIFDYLCDDARAGNASDAKLQTDESEPLVFRISERALAEHVHRVGMTVSTSMDHATMTDAYLVGSDGVAVGRPLAGFNFCCARK